MEDWARPVVIFEIRGREPEKLQQFYRDLFNWNIDDTSPLFAQVQAGIGGPEPGPIGVIYAGDPGAGFQVQVLDLRAAIDKAKALGGSIVLEPTLLPGGAVTIARIADPEGTQIGLVQQ